MSMPYLVPVKRGTMKYAQDVKTMREQDEASKNHSAVLCQWKKKASGLIELKENKRTCMRIGVWEVIA